MKIAYFDCFAGAGGDMIVAAMLDAGVDAGWLIEQIDSLAIEGLHIEITETTRSGMRGLKFTPIVKTEQKHRNLADILEIVAASKISDPAKKQVASVFNALAQAEAYVHGKTVDQIHFHEVGAVDSIVDIVAASAALDALQIDQVHCSTISVGGGSFKCAHGIMSAPAPATIELLKRAKAPFKGGPIEKELFTPTAAAILTTIASNFGPMPPMKVSTIGCGAGTIDAESFPNLLRLTIGQTVDADNADTDHICLLETNIDDITAEHIGFVFEKLLDAGALDVFTAPIQMKQNRPAVKLSVICQPQKSEIIEQIIFEEGITLGIRKQILQRKKIIRQTTQVDTVFGTISIKTASFNGKIVKIKPEFSDCRDAAKSYNVALNLVRQAAMKAYDQGI
ncbi:MAG: nickel pincer cofactor biosynthesis protein LarC [Planctomycetes bacterium]|nr:nickel pincer cofactor biosynthesis protein LarC [Planctomycetota bacterium]